MLIASRPIGLFDRYRVPYTVDTTIAEGVVRILRGDGVGAELVAVSGAGDADPEPYRLEGAFLYTALASRSTLEARLDPSHGEWRVELDVLAPDGTPRASIWRATDGSVVLPFDLDEPLDNLLAENYVPNGGGSIRSLARRAYYRSRPILPYPLQMALRRGFQRFQDRTVFPSWPVETSFHRLEALVLSLVESVVGEPVPWIAPWPTPYRWALVLTHDIERIGGYRHLDRVLETEQRLGLRSAWYFVPERDYAVEDSTLELLRRSGCEVCLHGLRHDGRDLSPGTFEDRLPAMRSYLERWGACGFRGPSTHRERALLEGLGIEHDSSWLDVARYEPQPGGTCSWLPFIIGDVVELPISLPMDHTLFELQRMRDAELWVTKTAFLREQEGMALMVTHPDYLLDGERLETYARFLATVVTDDTVWRALPREVASWWQRRAESRIERVGTGWRLVGPAERDGAIRVGAPPIPPAYWDKAPPAAA